MSLEVRDDVSSILILFCGNGNHCYEKYGNMSLLFANNVQKPWRFDKEFSKLDLFNVNFREKEHTSWFSQFLQILRYEIKWKELFVPVVSQKVNTLNIVKISLHLSKPFSISYPHSTLVRYDLSKICVIYFLIALQHICICGKFNDWFATSNLENKQK